MTMTRPNHEKDSDCTVGADDMCTACGVHHGDPCGACGGRGFHAVDCRFLVGCVDCGAGPDEGCANTCNSRAEVA
jgi:hypothetical protein